MSSLSTQQKAHQAQNLDEKLPASNTTNLRLNQKGLHEVDLSAIKDPKALLGAIQKYCSSFGPLADKIEPFEEPKAYLGYLKNQQIIPGQFTHFKMRFVEATDASGKITPIAAMHSRVLPIPSEHGYRKFGLEEYPLSNQANPAGRATESHLRREFFRDAQKMKLEGIFTEYVDPRLATGAEKQSKGQGLNEDVNRFKSDYLALDMKYLQPDFTGKGNRGKYGLAFHELPNGHAVIERDGKKFLDGKVVLKMYRSLCNAWGVDADKDAGYAQAKAEIERLHNLVPLIPLTSERSCTGAAQAEREAGKLR